MMEEAEKGELRLFRRLRIADKVVDVGETPRKYWELPLE